MNYFYLRVSNNQLSFENQLLKVKEYSNDNNLNVDKIIKDVSNGFENKQGNCLFDLLNKMNCNDNLYCYNISRISRRADKLVSFYHIINLKNIRVNYLIESNEELIIEKAPFELSVILSNISEINTEYISIVAKKALKNLKDKGIQLGRPKKLDSELAKEVVQYYKSGHTLSEVAEKFQISRATACRAVRASEGLLKETKGTNNIADIPLETKLEIWGDKKMGKTDEELSEIYHLDIDVIEDIVESLKGGAHW